MKTEVMYDARAEFLLASKEVGVLVIHGFTGTTQSMRLVAYILHEKGYTVNMPRLEGHGTSPEDMEACTYQDWINSVTKAFDALRKVVKEIFVLGLSMGGTLTLYCALNLDVKGAITINAAVSIPDFKTIFEDPNTQRFIPGIGSDIKKTSVTELAYTKTPKRSIGEIVNLSELVRQNLSKIKCPILIFSSYEDHVVPTNNQPYIFDHVGSKYKELIVLENSYHVATLDNDLNIIVDKTIAFIENNK